MAKEGSSPTRAFVLVKLRDSPPHIAGIMIVAMRCHARPDAELADRARFATP
jgi:hypothetical protein